MSWIPAATTFLCGQRSKCADLSERLRSLIQIYYILCVTVDITVFLDYNVLILMEIYNCN